VTVHGPVDVLAEFGSAQFRRDPHPFLRWLRENEPVHRTTAGFYLASRHADAEWLLRNTGTVFRGFDSDQVAAAFPQARRHPSVALVVNSLATRNPPEHTRLRRRVAAGFTPRQVSELRARICQHCEELLDAMAEPLREGAVIDLHTRLSEPLTVQVISTMLGVPGDDRRWLAGMVLGIVSGFGTGSQELLRRADDCVRLLDGYFATLIGQRRREPRADLIPALSHIGAGPDVLTDGEVISLLGSLWVAGFGSTAAGIDMGALSMMAYPDECWWLEGDPGKVAAFADEVLRHTGGPLLYTSIPRLAARDLELAGVPIAAGSDVRPLLAAANRDPAAFPGPDRFDPSRDNRRALPFGAGIHYCLGAFLAREEMAIALSGLRRRFPTLVPAGEPTWNGHGNARVPLAVPVALER
jgi:cytochrome P450 family 114